MDFYVALVVFIGILAYLVFQLLQVAPVSSTNAKEESIRIETYQIAELLVNDGGHPLDWESKQLSEIKRIGLSDITRNVTNYLSRAKIDRLEAICNTPTGYQDVKKLLDVQDEMSISFINHTLPTDTKWICESSTPTSKKFTFNVSRTVSIVDTGFAELIVEVWEI